MLEQQQANRELIRNLAHEIKNPLGGIRGAAQLLERELDRPQLVEYTQVIIGEADRLQRARQPPAHAAPRAAYRAGSTSTRCSCACEGVVQAEFPAIAIALRFRHEPARARCAITSS